MIDWLRRLLLIPVFALLVVAGLATLALAMLLAAPLADPAPNPSLNAAARAIDRTGSPPPTPFQARDGTTLFYRFYEPPGDAAEPAGPVVVAIHGSAGNATDLNEVSRYLAANGMTVAAPDIRGHGLSGTRGDIAHIGQLDEDLADLLDELRDRHGARSYVLLGYSSGGGFALKAVTGPLGPAFESAVLLAPYLGPFAPTSRDLPPEDTWAFANVPRIIALNLMRRAGVTCCEALKVLAFALPAESVRFATRTYTYRLATDFGPPDDPEAAFTASPLPIGIVAGRDDELMDAARYVEMLQGASTDQIVDLIDGTDHLGLISDPSAFPAILAAVQRR